MYTSWKKTQRLFCPVTIVWQALLDHRLQDVIGDRAGGKGRISQKPCDDLAIQVLLVPEVICPQFTISGSNNVLIWA